MQVKFVSENQVTIMIVAGALASLVLYISFPHVLNWLRHRIEAPKARRHETITGQFPVISDARITAFLEEADSGHAYGTHPKVAAYVAGAPVPQRLKPDDLVTNGRHTAV